MNEYEKQAQDFLDATGTEFSAKFLKYDFYFPNDKQKRDIYEITLKKGERKYIFRFGQSIANSGFKFVRNNGTEIKFIKIFNPYEILQKLNNNLDYKIPLKEFYVLKRYGIKQKNIKKLREEPTPYNVLACLTKYDVGSFENFCGDFGYDEDSRSAEKIYNAVVKEFKELQTLFSDEELEKMGEIQ